MGSEKLVLGAADYAIFGATLVISAAIGVYFQFSGSKNASNEDYLLGGRNMATWPVAFSILATFMSATNLMGIPAEVYMYGTQLAFINISFVFMPIVSNYMFLPIFFSNNFTSAYEYLEKRFGKTTRRMLSAMFSLQIGLFTATTLYAPALALSAVTDLSLWMAIIAIGAVCTFYCTLGGMKAVLWTDVFQAFLMIVSLVTVIAVGCVTMGLGNIFQEAYDGGRLLVPSFELDIGKQYTMYNILTMGMLFGLSTYGGSQIALQRLMSVQTLERSRKVSLISIPLCVGFNLMCTLSGLVVYAYFKSCDPLSGQDQPIESPDQLMPYFITSSMRSLPGLPGLCIAGIFSASLSTVSSAVNSLAAVTYEDFVAPLVPKARTNPVLYTKLLSLSYGCVCIGVSFLMSSLGSLIKLTIIIYGLFAGPNLAVFILGACTTHTNEEGVVIGLVISLAIGAYLNFIPDVPPAPWLPVSDECPLVLKNETMSNGTVAWSTEMNMTTVATTMDAEEDGFPVAYMWFSMISLLSCMICAYLGSLIVVFFRGKKPDVEEIYLSPMRTWFFKKHRNSKTKDSGKEKPATRSNKINFSIARDTAL